MLVLFIKSNNIKRTSEFVKDVVIVENSVKVKSLELTHIYYSPLFISEPIFLKEGAIRNLFLFFKT